MYGYFSQKSQNDIFRFLILSDWQSKTQRTLHLLSGMMKKSSKSSHLRSWNQTTFDKKWLKSINWFLKMYKQDYFLFSNMHIKHFIWPLSDYSAQIQPCSENKSNSSGVIITPLLCFHSSMCVFQSYRVLKPPEGHGALDILRHAKWPWKVWIQVRRRKTPKLQLQAFSMTAAI